MMAMSNAKGEATAPIRRPPGVAAAAAAAAAIADNGRLTAARRAESRAYDWPKALDREPYRTRLLLM